MTEQRREAKASEYIEYIEAGDTAGVVKYLEECFGADNAHTPEDVVAMQTFSDEVLPMVQDMINETVETATVAPAAVEAAGTEGVMSASEAGLNKTENAAEEAVDATDSAETPAV